LQPKQIICIERATRRGADDVNRLHRMAARHVSVLLPFVAGNRCE
jgi:hypothetical protein